MATGDLAADINRIVCHYNATSRWQEYSAKRLTKRGAQLYVQQHGIFTRHSRCDWAAVVANCPEVEVRRFIVRENLYEEEGDPETAHYTWLVRLGQALGLTAEEVEDAVALPTTRVAFLVWERLTTGRHWLIGCAAKASLEQPNQPDCGRFSLTQGQLWQQKFGLSRETLHFWFAHDEIDQVHGPGAFGLVFKHLARSGAVEPSQILAAVEESMLAWRLFLDGICDAAEAVDTQTAGRVSRPATAAE